MRDRMALLDDVPEELNATATAFIDAAGHVRRRLGAGLPERFYHRALEIELSRRGIAFVSRPKVLIAYEGETLGHVIPDLIVGSVVVEAKAVEEIHPAHEAQLLTYLTATGLRLGLLINFGAVPFGTGIRRKVNPNAPA